MRAKTGIFFSVLLFFLLALQSLAFADTVISPNNYHQGRADIHDGIVTWKRELGGATGWDIFMNNLSDLTNPGEKDVTSGPSGSGEAGDQINPATNGVTIVWENWVRDAERSLAAGRDIYTADIYSNFLGFEQPLITGTGNQGVLAVSGNTVVYCNDIDNKIYYVYLNDPNNPRPVSNGPETGSQWEPRISGNKVVWMDHRGGSWNIFEKELPNGSEHRLTNSADNEYPDISGNIAAWRSFQNSQWDVHWMNLANGIDNKLTNDVSFQWSIRISGSLLVWMDADSEATENHSDIYAEDLNTGIKTKVADRSTTPADPAVDQGTVVWQDNSAVYGNDNILAAQVPTADVSLNLLSNHAVWATFEDWTNHILTVQYTIGDAAGSAPAYGVQVLASTPFTSGVHLYSSTPVAVGDIAPGGQAVVPVQYTVPENVTLFYAAVYASGRNNCGETLYFPGPPPQ